MAKITEGQISRWHEMVRQYLVRLGSHAGKVEQGWQAWNIADKVGILREAYLDRTVTDGHIQTALQKVFPNCTFKDKKVY